MGTPVEEPSSSGNEEVQGNNGPDQPNNSPGPNPAWNDVLSIIPESLHSQITPHFQKWDQAAQSRIESVNAQYKDYAPFVEHGITRDQIIEGLQLTHTINTDPRVIYDALVEQHGFTPKQAAEAVEEIVEEEEADPRYKRLEEGFNTLAQHVLAEQEAKQAREADALVAKELEVAKQKYGDFNEQFVIDRMVSRMEAGSDYTIDQAVQDFHALRDSILKEHQQPYSPMVLGGTSGGGSGLPSNAVNVNKLSDGETKNLVIEMLRASQAQR